MLSDDLCAHILSISHGAKATAIDAAYWTEGDERTSARKT